MTSGDMLAEQFESYRGHLRAVAYRLLGSATEADDAVQEAWLRLHRTGGQDVRNIGGWLTTVVARVCLDMLRSRTARREAPLDAELASLGAGPGGPAGSGDPEQEALLADSVGVALLVVLDTLSPKERLAFVLHDMFAVPFDEIAPILDRSPNAAKMLASRARRRVQGAGADGDVDGDRSRQHEVVSAFLAASRDGDFAALLALLDPDTVVRADQATVAMGGASPELRGASDVATMFVGKAQAARLMLVDGAAGWVWSLRGEPRVVFSFTVTDGKITEIALVADPDRLAAFDLAPA